MLRPLGSGHARFRLDALSLYTLQSQVIGKNLFSHRGAKILKFEMTSFPIPNWQPSKIGSNNLFRILLFFSYLSFSSNKPRTFVSPLGVLV